MPPISYSRAALFEKCPLRFKAECIDKVPRPLGLPLLVGQYLHEVTDRYVKHLIATQQASDFGQMEVIFKDLWPKRPTGIPEFLRAETWDVAVRIREMTVLEIQQVVGSEVSISLTKDFLHTTWEAPNAFLRMKLDRLEIDQENNALIEDLKTGHGVEDVEDSMQLKLYGLGVMVTVPQVKTVKVRLLYPRAGIRREVDLNKEDVEEARRWILAVGESIAALEAGGSAPATPGVGCADCPVFDTCPSRRLAVPHRAPQTVAEAEAVAGRLIQMDVEYSLLKENLKFWISHHGPVEASGMVAELSPVRVRKYDSVILGKVLEEKGYRPVEYMNGDNTKLDKAAKTDDELRAALQAIVIDRSRTDFKLKKGEASE